jgi:hypothetical protein
MLSGVTSRVSTANIMIVHVHLIARYKLSSSKKLLALITKDEYGRLGSTYVLILIIENTREQIFF